MAKDKLAWVNLPTSKAKMIDLALATIKLSNEMEKMINKWELRSQATQMWTELKSFFAKVYSKLDWHAGVKVKQAGYESTSNIAKKRKKEA